MSEELEYSSYNKIKRLSDEELEALWLQYLADKTQKSLRDKLIVQYIYLKNLFTLGSLNNLTIAHIYEPICYLFVSRLLLNSIIYLII